MISTFTIANAKARRAVIANMARDAAIDSRRTVAILQHSTQYWLDTFASDPTTLSSSVLYDNYLKIAREFARREMRAIDLMHADLRRAELSGA